MTLNGVNLVVVFGTDALWAVLVRFEWAGFGLFFQRVIDDGRVDGFLV